MRQLSTHFLEAKQIVDELALTRAELFTQSRAHVYFTNIYLIITERLAEVAVAADNEDHHEHESFTHIDSAFLNRLIVHFAKRYLDAYAASKHENAEVPFLWSQVFERSELVSDAGTASLLGALVHMSFDLPLVLSKRLADQSQLFDSESKRMVKTYFEVDNIIARLLPRITESTSTLRKQLLDEYPYVEHRFRYRLFNSRLGDRIRQTVFLWLIRLTRREARWLDQKIRSGKCTQNDVEMFVYNRLKLIRGNGSAFWYVVFLSYGLLARLKNRVSLSRSPVFLNQQ